MYTLILASQSPRRSTILQNAGYQFVPFPVYVSEIPNKNLSLPEQILDIAHRKAIAAKTLWLAQGRGRGNEIILSADTMVCIDDKCLGKPQDEAEAATYLRLLSGRRHQVRTAVYLLNLANNEELSHIETTNVEFRKLTEAQIQSYLATGEPMDKAGAYAIQGKGGQFVEKLEGDFNNVVGLPLPALEKLFKLNAWTFQPPPETQF